MELSSDGGECKGGSGVGYGKKPMDSLEKQVHRVVNSSLSNDGCAQATRGFKGDGDGVIQPNLIGWNVKVKAMSLSPVDKWSTFDHQSPCEYNSVEL